MKITTSRKLTHLVPLTLPLFICSAASLEASIILFEDFETDGLGSRYMATSTFNDGADDYFMRTDGDTEASGIPPYVDFGGTYFWAAEDIDASDNPTGLAQLDFNGIDLSGQTGFVISLDMGAGSIVTFDSTEDHVFVQYRIDSGAWQTALAFQNDGTTFNSNLRLDADQDGVGEGTMLEFSLQNFQSAVIPAGGSLMDLRIDTLMNGTGEAVAFDNIQVTAIPEPAMSTLILLLVSLLLMWKKPYLPHRENESRA